MSDGRKRAAEDEEEAYWKQHLDHFKTKPPGKVLERLDSARDHLQRFYESDPMLNRMQNYHLNQAIEELRRIME
jgi:hypothetical protein